MIYIGADHRGYQLKEKIRNYLVRLGYEIKDVGAHHYAQRDDYPDFGKEVAKKVSRNPEKNKGILICGSGIGMDVLANKFKNVSSALVFHEKVAKTSREHNNANVLSLASDFLSEEKAKKIVKIWLEAKFSGVERHKRRLAKIKKRDR